MILNESNKIYQELDRRNDDWGKNFQNGLMNLDKYYLESAILIPESENFLRGISQIEKYYMSTYHQIKDIYDRTVICRAQLEGNKDMVFELGSFTTSNQEKYYNMIIWSNNEDVWYREMEVISKEQSQSIVEDPLLLTRKRWGELASNQGSRNLIEELYTLDCLYYNRGSLFCGPEQLNNAYSYMNQSDYEIHIEKEASVIVNPSLIYEIGRWVIPQYQDYYFVIWQKDSSGQWKMRLDSNF